MANRLYQGIVFQLKDITDRIAGVVDSTGQVIACSELGMQGEQRTPLMQPMTAGDVIRDNGWTYRVMAGSPMPDSAVFIEGTDDIANNSAAILAVALERIKKLYDDKYDKSNFVKNVVTDNILRGDIYAKARELHFVTDAKRVVLLFRVVKDSKTTTALGVISGLFTDTGRDFVFNISETDTVIVKEIRQEVGDADLENLAKSIVDTLEGEHNIKAIVGIGTIVSSVADLAQSFKEAQVALEVGKVFDTEHQILSYDNLGIARLIYHLPTTLCEQFLHEVFKKESIDSLDDETLFTIQRFFENNLNVSETSRGLFVHRNTLVYRIEKIQKLTGLNLRNFDDAIVFKVALMVKKYLDSNPTKY
ncbi:MAG: PucR family transcriptional regulator [Oscillospiraceae bacterium]|jgi:carbohydrate diacid regulator